mmetsp:Transcript_28309/g.53926  ORF Transcript_28309/g.53926 Transcript_28309/m.53926 type:complete len:266 (+) Transcript_28309:297-1094(+)
MAASGADLSVVFFSRRLRKNCAGSVLARVPAGLAVQGGAGPQGLHARAGGVRRRGGAASHQAGHLRSLPARSGVVPPRPPGIGRRRLRVALPPVGVPPAARPGGVHLLQDPDMARAAAVAGWSGRRALHRAERPSKRVVSLHPARGGDGADAHARGRAPRLLVQAQGLRQAGAGARRGSDSGVRIWRDGSLLHLLPALLAALVDLQEFTRRAAAGTGRGPHPRAAPPPRELRSRQAPPRGQERVPQQHHSGQPACPLHPGAAATV